MNVGKILRAKRTPVLPRRFRLRWRLEYVDGKRRLGMWDNSGEKEGALSRLPKTGLLRFVVEGESLIDHEVLPLVDIPGQAFAFAQWEGHVRPGCFGVGEMTFAPTLQGLAVWTNDERITAFVDGSVSRRPLRPEEKLFDFREHRAGT